jgi:hypothetical protein
MLLSLACQHQYPTASFNISSAYLYSPIKEEVYVQPLIELFLQWKGKIMRLKKAMYGTKQAARCWWKFFKGKMEELLDSWRLNLSHHCSSAEKPTTLLSSGCMLMTVLQWCCQN